MRSKQKVILLTILLCSLQLNAKEKAMKWDQEKAVQVDYTNWRGEKGTRTIVPESIYFGSTEWHPEKQWLLRAYDVEKQAYRDFALKDIASWIPAAIPSK